MQAVDLLLEQWNKAWHNLMAAEQAYEKSGCLKRPQGKLGCCGCTGAHSCGHNPAAVATDLQLWPPICSYGHQCCVLFEANDQ